MTPPLPPSKASLAERRLTMHVCGGKQARVCPVTKQPHEMSEMKLFEGVASIACKYCGVTAMQLDLLELP